MGLVNKKERLTFDGLENLTRFMVSPQYSMGDGYANRPWDNCWDGKTMRDTDKGVLSTYCTGCATLNEPFASEETKMEVWGRAKEMAILLPQELRLKNWVRATRKERQYISYYFNDGWDITGGPCCRGRSSRRRTWYRSATSTTHRRGRWPFTGNPIERG
jgi:hypothetical protein